MVQSKFLRGLWILAKGVIISIATFFGLMIGGFLASLLGIKSPAMPGAFNPGAMLFYRIISGMVFYIILGYFLNALKQKKATVFWLAFSFNFVVVNLLNIIEATYFTKMALMPYNLITGAGESLFVALGISLLFTAENPGPSFGRAFKEWISNFKAATVWRLAVSWLSFLIIYYAVGMIIAPVVLPYYQSSSFGLQLPSIATIIRVQLGRGALLLLFSLPLIALWKKSRLSFFLQFGLILFYKDVVMSLLAASWFPWTLRIVHGLELTVDSFLLAGVYSLMLIKKEAGVASLFKQPKM